MEESMTTDLARITALSRKNPDMVFTSIAHLIDFKMLKECHEAMDGNKAVGIDGITKAEYSIFLETNLGELLKRIRNKTYHPKPARRVEIPKDNGKTRPLNIYCYEDKIVQEALKRVLEAVFEPMFYNEMMGFRPNRDCHKALRLLNDMIEKRYTNYILDADIHAFFDNLSHDRCIQFIESRIKDPRIIRLVKVMLKAGVMKGFDYEETELGSGQGAVCSPIIANIYMHYVLLWWFKERIQPKQKGFCGIVVYADDFVVCFQHKREAEEFYELLKRRMRSFGLEMAEEKTRLIEFGKYAQENASRKNSHAETFTFLGFTHYCSKSRDGKRFRVKRKTSKKKLAKKCKEMNNDIRIRRGKNISEIVKWLNQVLVGYYRYYGIMDNYDGINRFYRFVIKKLYYWLNRRSQRRSFTWDDFNVVLKGYPLAKPKIYVNIYAT
jgi:group II intron reverse transcriptase/maturase